MRSNRRTAVFVVPRNRAEGIADGTVTTILSKRPFVKIGVPFFIMPIDSMETDLYIRLGTKRVISGGVGTADGTGLSQNEFEDYRGNRPVYAYDIREVVRLDEPVPLSRFGIPAPRPFTYSTLTLEEVLS